MQASFAGTKVASMQDPLSVAGCAAEPFRPHEVAGNVRLDENQGSGGISCDPTAMRLPAKSPRNLCPD
jgi:hypothetical protein